jgi:hypothetical protein
LAVKALNQGRSVRFFTGPELINWYRKYAQDNDPSEEESLNRNSQVAISFVGTIKEYITSEWANINLRCRYRKPSAFSSNYKPSVWDPDWVRPV